MPYTKEPDKKKGNAKNEKQEVAIQSENRESSSESKTDTSEKLLQVENGSTIDNTS